MGRSRGKVSYREKKSEKSDTIRNLYQFELVGRETTGSSHIVERGESREEKSGKQRRVR